MSRVSHDVMAFDVERALSRSLSIKCETFVCRPDEFRIRIGQRWNLVLTPEQLEELWNDIESPSALRDKFDSLKAECLVFQSLQR